MFLFVGIYTTSPLKNKIPNKIPQDSITISFHFHIPYKPIIEQLIVDSSAIILTLKEGIAKLFITTHTLMVINKADIAHLNDIRYLLFLSGIVSPPLEQLLEDHLDSNLLFLRVFLICS